MTAQGIDLMKWDSPLYPFYGSPMDFYIARQPIFDFNKRIHAYELLYRGTEEWNLQNIEGSRATSSLLSSTFLTEGIEKIAGSKPCFVNFTKELLLKNIPTAFPQNKLVVEILEDVEPTAEIVEACERINKEGYTLALDDFVYHSRYDPLLPFINVVKIDFLNTALDDVHKTLHHMSRFPHVRFLAGKVETYEVFEKALKLGFRYFQGYFFCKPEQILIHELASVKANMLRLLAEVSQKNTTLRRLEEIVSTDVGLTYKLLRYLNSAHFSLMEKVESVARAITFLGSNRFQRFVLLMLISEIASEKPDELIRLAVVRAKFCELLAELGTLREQSGELFLVGLFSLIDAMLDKSMMEIMGQMPLRFPVKVALTGRSGPYITILRAVESYERGMMDDCLRELQETEVATDGLQEAYFEATKYGEKLL